MATSAAFFVQGLCFAVVVTRVSVLQSKFHLSNGQLTLVLLIVPVIAGVGSVPVLTLVIIALAAGFEPGRTRRMRSEVAATAEAGSPAPG